MKYTIACAVLDERGETVERTVYANDIDLTVRETLRLAGTEDCWHCEALCVPVAKLDGKPYCHGCQVWANVALLKRKQ